MQNKFIVMESRSTLRGGKPPLLFRAATDDTFSSFSRGANTEDEIDPLFNTESSYHNDLFSNPHLFSTAMMMVYDYINCNYNALSELSSWSASLLFVLLHAIRKYWALDEGDVIIWIPTSIVANTLCSGFVKQVQTRELGQVPKNKDRDDRVLQRRVSHSPQASQYNGLVEGCEWKMPS